MFRKLFAVPLLLAACANTPSAFPDGVTLLPSGHLTVLSAPVPDASLFPTRAERDALRWGVDVEEAGRRRALGDELMRLRVSWSNAMHDREPGVGGLSYMDWDAVGETGVRGVEVVLVDSEFPEATLSYYVTHPNIRAVAMEPERRAVLARRDAYVAQLAELGITATVPEPDDGFPFAGYGIAILSIDAPGAEGLPPVPAGVSATYADAGPPPAFSDGMAAHMRTDQRISGGFGVTIQPAHRGRLVARDGCIYMRPGTDDGDVEHIAVLPAYVTVGRDRDGWPALLDGDGVFVARLGTRVMYTGAARVQAPPAGTLCAGGTAMDLPGVGNQAPRPDFVVPPPPR